MQACLELDYSRKTLRTAQLPRFPKEVIEKLLEHVEDDFEPRHNGSRAFHAVARQLLSCLRVCREWRPVAEQRLYRIVVLELSDGAGRGVHATSQNRVTKLLKTLEENADLAVHVHNLVLRCELLNSGNADHEDLWNLLVRGDYLAYKHTATGLIHSLTGIVGKCNNLEHFAADKGAAFHSIFLKNELMKKERLQTLYIPNMQPNLEQEFPDTYSKPEEILQMLRKSPHMSALVVKDFHLCPIRFGFDWLNPILSSEVTEAYLLDAAFLRSLLSMWKGQISSFYGHIAGDSDTAVAMAQCLAVWRPQLRSLAVFAQGGYEAIPEGPLTNAILELPHMQYLETTSDILHPSAFLRSTFASLLHLEYGIVSESDLQAFLAIKDCARENRGDGILPKLQMITIRWERLCNNTTNRQRFFPLIDQILEYFDERGAFFTMSDPRTYADGFYDP